MVDLFGTFGIRGVANEDITPDLAVRLGKALATHLDNEGKVGIGYDPRTSNKMLENALASGINSGGCDVLRFGMVPTPVLSFGTKHLPCDAGVMITASHNPPKYNGLKFWDSKGAGFVREKEDDIERIVEVGGKSVSWDRIGNSRKVEILSDYREMLNEKVSQFEKELKVVVDCANGAGGVISPHILTDLGCNVVSMNAQPDGRFPARLPEPTEDRIGELRKTVTSIDADLGIAHDGDADRTIIVDENGEVLSGDRVFALAARNYLKKKNNPKIITTVATSSILDEVVEELGGEVARTKVGEPELIREYRKNGGDLAGEENGGVIFPDWLLCRDGMMTAVQIIDLAAKTEKNVSELDETLPKYHQLKKNVKCPDHLKQAVLEDLSKKFEDENPDTTEGLRLAYEDGWFILRPSGTEPKFRCFAEAKTEERVEELSKKGMEALRESLDFVKKEKE